MMRLVKDAHIMNICLTQSLQCEQVMFYQGCFSEIYRTVTDN